MSLREMGKIVEDAVESGDLQVERADGEEDKKEKEAICEICGSKTGIFTCYSWFILNDEDYSDIIEMMFCSKDCWKKYLNKEIKRI